MATHSAPAKRRWSTFLPLLAGLVVMAEIAFLGLVNVEKSAAAVQHWTSFYFPSSPDDGASSLVPDAAVIVDEEDGGNGREIVSVVEDSGNGGEIVSVVEDSGNGGEIVSADEDSGNGGGIVSVVEDDPDLRRCEEWLEKEDAVGYSRDFRIDHVVVSGAEEQRWPSCSIGCKFGPKKVPDGTFTVARDPAIASIHRSMESSLYYVENNIDVARRRGFTVIMTTSLSSDVPVGYFSWAEYDIMAPMHPKTENAIAAAFISNCGARNFRIEALEMLGKFVRLDSYGTCRQTRDGKGVDKLEALKGYKFSLAFENSNEEDYVTEKYFQSLVAGTIPVVIGAPNIQDFAPSPESILHIKELGDVESVAKTMNYLAENSDAYNRSLSWKYDGPSDSFKALVDMAAVHSSCRLCIHIATKIWEKEEATPKFRKRPCKCNTSKGDVYHMYVRERGRFYMESIYLRSDKLTLNELELAVLSKFKSLNHTPIWKNERPESIRGDKLKVYKIYPVGLTQRRALYAFKFETDADLRKHVKSKPCAKFEVIFV